jgi:hypothetical protein
VGGATETGWAIRGGGGGGGTVEQPARTAMPLTATNVRSFIIALIPPKSLADQVHELKRKHKLARLTIDPHRTFHWLNWAITGNDAVKR